MKLSTAIFIACAVLAITTVVINLRVATRTYSLPKQEARLESLIPVIGMKPLDDYLQNYPLPTVCDKDNTPNSTLTYLLDLPTPCSTGKERCVLSFSLWCGGVRHGLGQDARCARYTRPLANLQGWKRIFKGWEIRIYTDGSVPFLNSYSNVANVVTVNASLRGAGTWGTMWRLLPLFEENVDRVLIRDVDSVPLVRDWATAYEWIRLGFPSYRWGDHPHHYSHPIMAGALGVSKHALTATQRRDLLHTFQKTSRFFSKYDDQEWYRAHLWPLLKRDMLSFDVLHCRDYSNPRPFPVPHSKCDWILGGSDQMFGERVQAQAECRHPRHSSWKWG